MAEVDTWQLPAADDITPDALDYLFIPQPDDHSGPPWVEIIAEPEQEAYDSPEITRLQTKVEILSGEVELLSTRLKQANCQVGYLQALLAEYERLLPSLPLPSEQMVGLVSTSVPASASAASVVPAYVAHSSNSASYSDGRSRNAALTHKGKGTTVRRFRLPTTLLTYLSMVSFAWTVLIMLLK